MGEGAPRTNLVAALGALLPQVAEMPIEELPALALQAAALQAAVATRLADDRRRPPPAEPLLTANETARRLGVGVDWVRDHGAEKGIEVRLSTGTVRYDPVAVDRLRRRAC